jgi:hypothetical protein
MSQRLNVDALIDAGVHTLVNLCPTDTRFYQYLNSFQERALSYGRWWGTTALMDFCATPDDNGVCVVLPREVAVIEALKVGGLPLMPKNTWYSYVTPHSSWGGCSSSAQSVYPYCGCGCGCGPAVSEDRLMVPSFAVTTTGQKIRFYFDPEDVGKKIVVQGYDSDNIWVRTEFDSAWQDGEQVTLATTGGEYYTDTVTEWYIGAPTGIIKETTAERVLMFAVDDPFASGDAAQQLATYQPSETRPSYRKFYLPSVRSACGDCSSMTVRAVVSLQHIPVSQPNDWLLFQSVPVYEDGVQAVRYWREGNRSEGDAYFFGMHTAPRSRRSDVATVKLSGALPTLQAELRKMTADLTTVQVNRAGTRLPGFV